MASRWRRRSAWLLARARADDGVSSIEFAILYASLLTLVMVAVHFGLLFNAALSVDHAANEALDAFTSRDVTATEAQAHAAAVLQGDGTIASSSVAVSLDTSDPEWAVATVRATSVRVLPGLPVNVSRTVTGRVEAFIPESER